jgi:hypothetical protein
VKKKIKFKSQAAMEYLMTYGWAILIIALTLGVLYSLGIMNPKNFLPRAPPGSCFVFRPNGPGTTDFISLQGTCGYLPMYVGSFNGVNGYIHIANSSPSTLLWPTSSLTVAVWFRANRLILPSALNCWFVLDCWYNNWYNPYSISITSTGKIIFTTQNGTADYSPSVSYGPISFGKWYYVVGVYNSSTLFLYVNGLNIGKVKGPNKLVTGEWIQIGATSWPNVNNPVASNSWFNGSIANVQIYNTALTPQEIQYLYQQGLGGAPVRLQNLVAWWPLNGDAKDYSGNNLHGTIYGVTFVQNYNPP